MEDRKETIEIVKGVLGVATLIIVVGVFCFNIGARVGRNDGYTAGYNRASNFDDKIINGYKGMVNEYIEHLRNDCK